MKKRMKSKQKEVGVQLPFTVQDTRTYQELCKEAKESIESTAADWIPRFCMALKRQHPLMAAAAIKKKVNNDWSDVWKGNTITKHWPDWMKDPVKVESGKMGKKASDEAKQKKKQSAQFKSSNSDQDTKQQEQSEAAKEQQRQNTLEQNILGDMNAVIERFTGLNETEVLKYGRDYQALRSATKDYRFDLTKKFSDLNLKMIYDDSRTLSVLLDDFLKQLDNELVSRKNKAALTSE
jgi:hypothetical protein